MILYHFAKMYTSSNPQAIEDCTVVIPRCVDTEVNSNLMRLVSDEEIKWVVFSLGPLKAPSDDGLDGIFFQYH